MDKSPSTEFNKNADLELEKRLSKYQLTKEEQQKVFDIRKSAIDQKQKEKDAMRDPETYRTRVRENFDDLKARRKLAPELNRAGERKWSGDAELLQQADTKTRTDSQQKMRTIDDRQNKEISQVLDQAREDGRGPKEQQQDRSPERQQTLTQEFNRNR